MSHQTELRVLERTVNMMNTPSRESLRNILRGQLTATLLGMLHLGLVHAQDRPANATVQTVSSVDLRRYTGVWYEIARLPNRFQKNCTSDVTATYTLRDDGKIRVLNQCLDESGKRKSAEGTARVVEGTSNAKLKVTFFWPFYGDYWILDLGSNYEYAVVGEPRRKYFWILSRTPQFNDQLYKQILERGARQGYDLTRLIKTRHS
jgi:apolipoprotein D and lipocalin family protein